MPKLTKRFVDSLRPVERDTIYRDTDLKGFALRHKPPSANHPQGARTWCVQYKTKAGRTRKLALGTVKEITPEQARTKATEALAEVKAGGDPSADRHTQRADMTVSKLVERYLAEGPADKPKKKASSWEIDASNLQRHVVPLLGRKSLASLTKADVQRFQRDVTEGKSKADAKGTKARGRIRVTGGPGVAWRATAVLAGMLAWAVDRKMAKENPAEKVKLNKLASRERFLTVEELADLGEAMAAIEGEGANPDSLAIVRLLILTGARRSEITSLKWEYVDFERGALRLPDSKTGAKVVPLGAPALDVLAGRQRRKGIEWVFPASRGDGPHMGLPAVWRRLAKAAGLTGVRLHDLRHGFASMAVAGNDSLYLVGKILGHTKASTTERYAHLALDPVRAVANRTSRKLADALDRGAGDPSKVVQLKRS